MLTRCKFSVSLLTALLISSLLSAGASEAVAQSVSTRNKVLTNNRRLSVRAVSCTLRVSTNSASIVRLACVGRRTSRRPPRSTSSTFFLRANDKTTITARSCFLRLTTNRPSRVDVQCTRTRPTATPTPTATFTSTPTPTATATPTVTPTPNANALLVNNQLLAFNTANVSGAETPISLTGVNAGDTIVSIDRRPLNGFLYGLGYNATTGIVTLYSISSQTGVAVPFAAGSAFSDGTNEVRVGVNASTQLGLDFNPLADRIRVVTSAGPTGPGQTFRMNPNTGENIDSDGGVTGINMDALINGAVTTVQECAYTNSQINATATTLYTIDSGNDALYIQNPPNAGMQSSPVGLTIPIDSVSGFDIEPGVNSATSNTAVSGGVGIALVKLSGNTNQTLANIDLVTGAVVSPGSLGASTSGLLGLAVQRPLSESIVALSADGLGLRRFNAMTPEQVTDVAVSGLTTGEVLVGIDFRPSTGELMALGVDATANTGTLYRIDPQVGSATTIGSASGIAFVDISGNPVDLPPLSSGYGLNFNPTVDRIRVVTGTGLNFRLNPVTGAAVDGDTGLSSVVTGTNPDGAINGATSTVQGTAYTNSFAQPASSLVTTQYTIDADSDSVYIQNSPNAGTQTQRIVLSQFGTSVNVTAVEGFDISSSVRASASNAAVASGRALAALTIAGTTSLYSIDLTSGALTLRGVVGDGATGLSGLTVGQSTVQ